MFVVETCTVLVPDVLGVVDDAGVLVELDGLLPLPPQPVAARATAIAIGTDWKRVTESPFPAQSGSVRLPSCQTYTITVAR
jgi:hypothetical protein